MNAPYRAAFLIVLSCFISRSGFADQTRAYVFGCTGDVAGVEIASRKTVDMRNLVTLGWAPAVRDGCVIYSLTYQPASDSLFAVVAGDPAVDANGLGRYALLQWKADQWTLVRKLEIENALSGIPNLLAPPAGTDLLVAFERGPENAMASVSLAAVGESVDLTALRVGPWFSPRARMGADGSILDGGKILRFSGARWEAHPLAAPAEAGFLRLDANAADGVFYAAKAGRRTRVQVVGAASGRVARFRIEGSFAPNELTPMPDGNALVSVPRTRGAAVLWDVASGRMIARTSLPPGNARAALCVGDAAIIRAGTALYLLGRHQSGAIESSVPADAMTGCAFAP